jgi:hypothetical protein
MNIVAPDETPPHARDTLPAPANDDGEPPPPIIPAGFARHALRAALEDAYRAMYMLAATADAVARQLDGETP